MNLTYWFPTVLGESTMPNADQEYKRMLEASAAEDIVYSSLFTGVHGNYLKPSIKNAGLDPDNLPDADKSSMNFGSGGNTDSKAWKDIWVLGRALVALKTLHLIILRIPLLLCGSLAGKVPDNQFFLYPHGKKKTFPGCK